MKALLPALTARRGESVQSDGCPSRRRCKRLWTHGDASQKEQLARPCGLPVSDYSLEVTRAPVRVAVPLFSLLVIFADKQADSGLSDGAHQL